jgi:ABC-2 type transport system ATP-binding protein
VTSAPPIEARDLVKRYGRITAVDHVDLSVSAGDVYGYLGPNGAGKTTSLRMLLGLIRPDGGSAKLFGRDPLVEGARALDGVAGFVEAPRFYPYLTGRRNLEMVASLDGDGATRRIDEALDTVDLADRARDKVGGYSHGMRQRLGIAGALLRAPRLLLLDEPTTGLDPGGMRDMRALIRRLAGQGITVLLSSHLMSEVEELCDRVAILGSGRVLYEGSLPELIATTAGRYEMRTTDDVYAAELASRRPDVTDIETTEEGLTFSAGEDSVAALSVTLGRAGVGIRSLHAQTATLEELFFRMTES